MATFRGLQGFCPLGPHLTRPRVQLFFSSFSQNSLPLPCSFQASLLFVLRILPPCLWFLHICVSSLSVLPCTLTVCPFVCLLYKPCFLISVFHPHPVLFHKLPFHFLPVSLLPLLSLPYRPCSDVCPWPLAFEINDSGPLAGFWKALRFFLPTPQVLLCS